MASPDYSSPFTLYTTTYSIRGIMVQTTFALRGPPRPGRPEMTLQPRYMSISPDNPEHLSESYLTTVNPKGQVPVLAGDAATPMPETVDISYYLCGWYPALLPGAHEDRIRALLAELHAIGFAVLTFGPANQAPARLVETARGYLAEPGVSEAYRRALEAKVAGLEQGAANMFSQASLDEHIGRTREFLAKVLELRLKNGSDTNEGYIFGSNPTVLDAHVLPFLARLCDVGKKDVVPPPLVEWVEHFRQGPVWKEVVPSYTTLPPWAPGP